MTQSILVTLEQVVEFVGELPDFLMPNGILFESGQKDAIADYRRHFKGVRLWLRHLVLKQALSPEAILTNYKYCQPQAEIYAAQLDLLTGLHPRSIISEPTFRHPYDSWWSLIRLQCIRTLENSGVLGKPLIQGKTAIADHNVALLKRVDNIISGQIPSGDNNAELTYSWIEDPESFIVAVAVDIALKDPQFDADYWSPYSKRAKKWERRIRDCPELKILLLMPDGTRFEGGTRKKPPTRFRATKGFGNQL